MVALMPAAEGRAAPAPRSYCEHYSDAANNPAAPDRTAGYLSGYQFTDEGGSGVPMPAVLRDQTTTALSDR